MSEPILLEAPEDPAVDLDVVKGHLRVEITDDDTYITSLIEVATRYVENRTNRQLIPAKWKIVLDCFPCSIDLPLMPVQTVDEIRYVDTDGTEQILDDSLYRLDLATGRVVPTYGESWPATREQLGAVEVDFTVGYEAVPAEARQSILFLVGLWYEARMAADEAQYSPIPFAVDSLCRMLRWR